MDKNSKIYVAGHRGLLGSAVTKILKESGYINIIVKTHKELDLCNQAEVFNFFEKEKPEYVIFAAAYVGGIGKNAEHPGPFIYDNIMMGFNIVEASRRYGVKKLINISSACIYPKNYSQPIKESDILKGDFDHTHESYAYAKLTVLKLCEKYNIEYGTDFITIVPNNLYGPNDNFGEGSHVLPSMIKKFHEAKENQKDEVTLWGDGSSKREFLYSEDLAEIIIHILNNVSAKELNGEYHINAGFGKDYTIKEVAEMVRSVVYKDEQNRECKIIWDTSKPNGVSQRLLNIEKLKRLNIVPSTDFVFGIENTYKDYIK